MERTFDYVRINLASPARIRTWGERILPNGQIVGEVTKPETINYRTLKPEMNGLFCERIFGPVNDWECHCGKYKRVRHNGIVCERCGVEVIESRVRRHRMGFIELASPATHVWYVKARPSKIALLLDLSLKELEQVIYFNSYIVINPGGVKNLAYKTLLTETDWAALDYTEEEKEKIEILMGAEAIEKLLNNINLEDEAKYLRGLIPTLKNTGPDKDKCIKKLRIIDQFIATGCSPSWMILKLIPVLPPDLRPMVQLDGGRFATSDLNDLYRRVINRNNRLARLQEIMAPELIIRNEKRMLQEAVDALIDNGKRGRAVVGLRRSLLRVASCLPRRKRVPLGARLRVASAQFLASAIPNPDRRQDARPRRAHAERPIGIHNCADEGAARRRVGHRLERLLCRGGRSAARRRVAHARPLSRRPRLRAVDGATSTRRRREAEGNGATSFDREESEGWRCAARHSGH